MAPDSVLHICRTLRSAGHEAWVVGGAVRDMLLGREAHDWDIATDALPEAVVELFPRVIETGIKHGTVTVLVGKEGFEVTTFRSDGDYSDGRRPDSVQFVRTIEEDLARRDFTVNAIAWDPISGYFRDPHKGRWDITQQTLRAVGNPLQRFSEDGLRVLRVVRFAATLEFEIDPWTWNSIRPSLEVFSQVAAERVRDEWLKALRAREPSKAFRAMALTGILEVTSSELNRLVGCTQNRYHTHDAWEHTLRVVDACPASDPILRMAALLHDVGKPVVKGVHPKTGEPLFADHENVGADLAKVICSRLRFSSEERSRIEHLVRHHFIHYESTWTDATVRRWVRRVGLEHVPSLFLLAQADLSGKGPGTAGMKVSAIEELEARVRALQTSEVLPTSTKVLVVDGRDLMGHLKIKPGPVVGDLLNHLLEFVTEDPRRNTRENLLKEASRFVSV